MNKCLCFDGKQKNENIVIEDRNQCEKSTMMLPNVSPCQDFSLSSIDQYNQGAILSNDCTDDPNYEPLAEMENSINESEFSSSSGQEDAEVPAVDDFHITADQDEDRGLMDTIPKKK